MKKEEFLKEVAELKKQQQQKLLKLAREILPFVTSDDILQPNDFPELENHPYFRYEEGVLAGIQAVEVLYQFTLKRVE